jgi:hypothetical protein
MSQAAAIALMMNNYLHDVATALLVASGFVLWVALARLEEGPRAPAADRYFLALQRSMRRLVSFSLAWIVLGGIPRVIWYEEFEWANAAGRGQVAALVVKHLVALAFVGLGLAFRARLNARVRRIEEELRPDP